MQCSTIENYGKTKKKCQQGQRTRQRHKQILNMHLVASGSLGGFGSAHSPLDLGPNLGPIGGGGLGGQSVGLGGQSLGGGQSVGFGVGQSGLGGQSLGGQSVLGGQSLGGQNVGLGGQSMGGQNLGLGVGQSGLGGQSVSLGGHTMGGPPPGLSSQGVQRLGGLGKRGGERIKNSSIG